MTNTFTFKTMYSLRLCKTKSSRSNLYLDDLIKHLVKLFWLYFSFWKIVHNWTLINVLYLTLTLLLKVQLEVLTTSLNSYKALVNGRNKKCTLRFSIPNSKTVTNELLILPFRFLIIFSRSLLPLYLSE